MYIKEHINDFGELLVAACDGDLLGKTFEEGELELKVTPSFYGDQQIDEADFVRKLSECVHGNLVGKQVVGIAKKLNLITDEHVRTIDNIPFALFVKVESKV